jgi:uncharacterized cupredoxin-like copper-binding protein
MEGGKGIKVAALLGLVGVVLALLSACGGAASQQDYDAVKQQLAAKEQEAAAAKQQVTALQKQIEPAAPREPKRLEAKITIDMGETGKDQMWFATPQGAKGGPFRLPAGKTVGIHFVNKGEKKHEFLFGRTVLKTPQGQLDGYQVNLFEKVAADLFVYYYPSGKMVEIGGAKFEEIEVEPGAEVWIRVNFPAELKGEWEIGCFVEEPGEKGHYDQGMKAKLIVE